MTIALTNEDSIISPVYRVLPQFKNVGAAYTGKGTLPLNNYFSFQRPSASCHPRFLNVFTSNLTELAKREAFDPARVVWPNGGWPHSGDAIKVEDHIFVTNLRTGGLMPVTASNEAITYDGIATASKEYVLAVQGADCPSIFLYDPTSGVIGLVHAGWKPVVRGVIQNTLDVMKQSGAKPKNVLAYISPGAGDKYNEFLWDKRMEPHIKDVFVEADQQHLLEDRTIRYEMSDQDRFDLASVLGRDVQGGISFKISEFVATVLERCGVLHCNITRSHDSSIVSRNLTSGGTESASFRYHSFRRERPGHGLSMSIMFLKAEPETEVGHI
jgi:copper oxidase (laccase) domain-containing protein